MYETQIYSIIHTMKTLNWKFFKKVFGAIIKRRKEEKEKTLERLSVNKGNCENEAIKEELIYPFLVFVLLSESLLR